MRIFTVRETSWINAPPAAVWHRVTSLEKWPDWNRALVAATWKGKPGFAEGHRFRLTYPKRARPFLGGGKVERVETGAELCWSDSYLTLRVEFVLSFTPKGRGTEINFASQFSGFGARFVTTDSFVRWLTQFQREFLVNLREACENVSEDRWSEV